MRPARYTVGGSHWDRFTRRVSIGTGSVSPILGKKLILDKGHTKEILHCVTYLSWPLNVWQCINKIARFDHKRYYPNKETVFRWTGSQRNNNGTCFYCDGALRVIRKRAYSLFGRIIFGYCATKQLTCIKYI